MKKLLSVLFASTLFLTQCNVVEDPYADNQGPIGPGEEDFNDTVYNDTNVTVRKIMLEEFTGQECPNCPEGQEIAHNIEQANPDKFIVVSIHNSGTFSKPNPPKFPDNYETETGEMLRIKFKAGTFPIGLMNRIVDPNTGKHLIDYNLWPSVFNSLVSDPDYMKPRFKLYLESIYNTKDRSVRLRPKVVALQPVTGKIAIAAYIIENKIISPQEDNRYTPSYIPDYEQNNVLRAGFPAKGVGKTIFTNPHTGDVYETLTLEDELSYEVSVDWKPENCEVIVFIYNIDTEEILQAEKIKLANM